MFWTWTEVADLLGLFGKAFDVAEAQDLDALVTAELQDFKPMVADPSMWQSIEVGYLLSHASQTWQLRAFEPVGTFLKQLPEAQAESLSTAYTDFGL